MLFLKLDFDSDSDNELNCNQGVNMVEYGTSKVVYNEVRVQKCPHYTDRCLTGSLKFTPKDPAQTSIY